MSAAVVSALSRLQDIRALNANETRSIVATKRAYYDSAGATDESSLTVTGLSEMAFWTHFSYKRTRFAGF